MAITHLFFVTQTPIAWFISVLVIIALFILQKVKKIGIDEMFACRLIIVEHVLFHIGGLIFQTVVYPAWIIWPEIFLVTAELITLTVSKGFIKGLKSFLLIILFVFAINIAIEAICAIGIASAEIILLVAAIILVFSLWRLSWVIFWFPRLLQL